MTTEQMDWIDDQINAGKMKPRGLNKPDEIACPEHPEVSE